MCCVVDLLTRTLPVTTCSQTSSYLTSLLLSWLPVTLTTIRSASDTCYWHSGCWAVGQMGCWRLKTYWCYMSQFCRVVVYVSVRSYTLTTNYFLQIGGQSSFFGSFTASRMFFGWYSAKQFLCWNSTTIVCSSTVAWLLVCSVLHCHCFCSAFGFCLLCFTLHAKSSP